MVEHVNNIIYAVILYIVFNYIIIFQLCLFIIIVAEHVWKHAKPLENQRTCSLKS